MARSTAWKSRAVQTPALPFLLSQVQGHGQSIQSWLNPSSHWPIRRTWPREDTIDCRNGMKGAVPDDRTHTT